VEDPDSRPPISAKQWIALRQRFALSLREQQVADHILLDEKDLCIARNLGISVHTVHTYIERIYHKLKVTSRVGLVVRLVGAKFDCGPGGSCAFAEGCPRRLQGECPLSD
jgi:DNA-binding CsgD family transcriptional regulator